MATPEEKRAGLRAFMDAHGLTALGWAEEAGVSDRTIGNFLAGRSRSLNVRTAEKLAAVVGVNHDEIFLPPNAGTMVESAHLESEHSGRVDHGGPAHMDKTVYWAAVEFLARLTNDEERTNAFIEACKRAETKVRAESRVRKANPT